MKSRKNLVKAELELNRDDWLVLFLCGSNSLVGTSMRYCKVLEQIREIAIGGPDLINAKPKVLRERAAPKTKKKTYKRKKKKKL